MLKIGSEWGTYVKDQKLDFLLILFVIKIHASYDTAYNIARYAMTFVNSSNTGANGEGNKEQKYYDPG